MLDDDVTKKSVGWLQLLFRYLAVLAGAYLIGDMDVEVAEELGVQPVIDDSLSQRKKGQNESSYEDDPWNALAVDAYSRIAQKNQQKGCKQLHAGYYDFCKQMNFSAMGD